MFESEDEKKSSFLEDLEREEQALLNKKDTPISPFSRALRKKKKKKSRRKGGRKIPTVAIFATVFLLFLVIVVLLVFTMAIGGEGNPVIQFFGQREDTIKEFLLQMVNGSFGTLSVILLLIIAVTLFYAFSLPKKEAQKRSVSFLFSFVSIGLQFVTILAWLGMYNFVSALEAKVSERDENILLFLREGRDIRRIDIPQVKDIVVPAVLGFSAEEFIKSIPREQIERFFWDFNDDGVFESETKDVFIERRIQRHGVHEISVKILLVDGTEIIKSIRLEIPQGSFHALPDYGSIPLTVTFDASSISSPYRGSIAQYEWDFDNDFFYEETTSGPTVLHTFDKIGIYTINLRIVDKNQTLEVYSQQIETVKKTIDPITTIINTRPAYTSISQKRLEITQGDVVLFDGLESWSEEGKLTKYSWRFTDVTELVRGDTVKHRFLESGRFEVILTVTDEAGNISDKKAFIIVSPPPSAPKIVLKTDPKANVRGNIVGTVPFSVSFSASQSLDKDNDIVSYEWDFNGDGNVDEIGDRILHTFDVVGEYETMLTIRDKNGDSDKKRIKIIVEKKELQAKIHLESPSEYVPCTFEFDGSLSSCHSDVANECKIHAYAWDFGDGTSSKVTSAKQRHPYDKVGIFTITLEVFTETERASTKMDVFCLETPVDACFTSSKIIGTAPLHTRFDPGCSTGTVESWHWDFGDGESSDDRIPKHVYQKRGTYSAVLTVSDASRNIDTYSLDIVVE